MLTSLFYTVFLPSLATATALAVVYFFLSSNRHKGLPRALASGFGGSNYVLTRGKMRGVSDFFYDLDDSITDYKLLGSILEFYTSSLQEFQRRYGRIDRLAFLEKDSGPVGAVAILGFLSHKLKISSVIIRQRRRLPINSVKGYLHEKSINNIVIISDVTTTGGGIEAAIKKLETEKTKVLGAVVLVNRMNEEDMNRLGIPLFYAIHIKEKSELEREPMKSYIERKMKTKGKDCQLPEAA